jgi:uncharacterized protein YdaU (DUF1376 family)
MKPMTDKLKQQLQETLGYRPPAFQFYPDDWLGSSAIAMMLPEQEGAYIRLLAICWGSPRLAIPNDPDRLAVMSRLNGRWKDLGPQVLSCFEPHPIDGEGWLTNTKLIQVRHRTMVRADAGSEGGKETQAKRKQKLKQTGKQNQTLPMSLPSGVPSSRVSGVPELLSAPASPDAGNEPDGKPAPKPRAPTEQQVRVKAMADAYSAAYSELTGKELAGKSIKSLYSAIGEWDKAQPMKDAGVKEWLATIPKLVQAHKYDKTFHPFPTSIYKLTNGWSTYCTDMWMDGARVNAEKRGRTAADPKAEELRQKAQRCLRDNPECRGGQAPACAYCARTVKGSKR